MTKHRLLGPIALALFCSALVAFAAAWLWHPDPDPSSAEIANARTSDQRKSTEDSQEESYNPFKRDHEVRFPQFDERFVKLDEKAIAGERLNVMSFANYTFVHGGLPYNVTAGYFVEHAALEDDMSDERMITELADLNASFMEDERFDLGPSGPWSAIRVHIGSFSQDCCGPLKVIVTFRSSDIYALSTNMSELDLSKSGCDLEGTESFPNMAPDLYIERRKQCIRSYYKDPKHLAYVGSAALYAFASVVVR